MRLFELSHTSNTPVFQLMNTKLNKVVNITVSMMYLILPQIQTSFRENCFSHINGWIWVSRQTEACCVNMLQTKRPAFPVWIKSTGLVGRSYCFIFCTSSTYLQEQSFSVKMCLFFYLTHVKITNSHRCSCLSVRQWDNRKHFSVQRLKTLVHLASDSF